MPEKLTLESAAQDRQWVFPLLTLDVVHPFYDLMGLHQEAEAGRHEALRAATLATRKQRAETLASFCQDLQERIDPVVADHLAGWIRRVAYEDVQAHVPVSNWKDVLRRCHRKGQRGWGRLAFPKQLSSDALARFAASIDVQEYRRLDQTLDESPLSDWDLHMYASQMYDFDEQLEGPSRNPSTTVSLTVDVYQQYVFWAWALRALTPQQQTDLHDRALEIVRTDKLPWIKDLVHPSALDIGL